MQASADGAQSCQTTQARRDRSADTTPTSAPTPAAMSDHHEHGHSEHGHSEHGHSEHGHEHDGDCCGHDHGHEDGHDHGHGHSHGHGHADGAEADLPAFDAAEFGGEDISGDGGVYKRVDRVGDAAGASPPPGSKVKVHYVGTSSCSTSLVCDRL